jgi:class 3 adenylate cyclase/tetratricopeptide (TPR) repeat protein
MSACPVCGQPAPPEARFCPLCGAALTAKADQEERKIVSVLFADLVGFTSISEELDMEDVRHTLALYHRLVRVELERFGGAVEKFIGDAVVGVFGAPASREDDADRAVRAALAIQAAARARREQDPAFSVHVRVGVNTGEALVALHANPLAGEGLAAGDVVNTAARLQSVAPIDGVLVGEATQRATSRTIRYREAPPVQLKGKREQVRVWIAESAEPIGAAELGSRVPLVGRRAELDALWSALTAARSTCTPQLVTVVGAPGIGKSRLVAELLDLIAADPVEMICRKGRSLPYGDGVTFWALAEIVKGEAGILHSDDARTADAKLRRAVVSLVDDPRITDGLVAELRPLVGLEHRQELRGDRQVEAFAAWRRFIEALGRRAPLVLVFEDLHWADQALLDFIEQLQQWTLNTPLLLLCTARPELLERRPAWGRTGVLTLPPLSGAETAVLVASMLDEIPLPPPVQETLIERAHGNALYAQEYVRMLIDRGLIVRRDDRWALTGDDELPLPDTVQGIIAARLDALTADEKAVIQDASVIGKVVWLGAVAHVERRDPAFVREQLQTLQRKQLLRLHHVTSVATETQYAFTHALVRDVAYSQIVRPARADKHLRAAEWIESLGGDRADRVELLAHHYVTALELGAAAGMADHLPSRARTALVEAADRASSMSAYAAAARFYSQALKLYDTDIPLVLQYRHAKARMYGEEVLPDDLAPIAGRLAEEGDLETASEVESEIGLWLDQHGHKDEALTHLRRAVALLQSTPTSAAMASALVSLASVLVLRGLLDEAIDAATRSGSLATSLGLEDLAAWSHQTLALAFLQSGDVRGIDEFRKAQAIAHDLETYDGAMIEHNYGVAVIALGDLQEARRAQLHAKARAQRLGLAYTSRLVDGTLGCLMFHAGEWDEARTVAERVIAEAAGSMHGDTVEAHAICGRLDLAGGRADLAADHAAAALALARDIGEPQYFVPPLGLQAQLHVTEGRVDEATDCVRELLDRWWMGVAISAETLTCAALAASSLPEVRDAFVAATSGYPLPSAWVEAGRSLAARDYTTAASLYAQIGSLPDEAIARFEAGRSLVEGGDHAAGFAELEQSVTLWRRVGASGYIEAAEKLVSARSAPE